MVSRPDNRWPGLGAKGARTKSDCRPHVVLGFAEGPGVENPFSR